jgi:ABC-2 type transport system permease protein
MAFYPSIRDSQDIDDVIADLPPAMQALFGLQDGVSISSAPGYLHARLFAALFPILLIVLAIGTGAAAVGGSEEDGTLELLLSNPMTRARLLAERYTALVLLLAGHLVLFTVEALALAAAFDALDGVSKGGFLVASAGAGAIALLHGTIAFTVGAWTGRRTTAIAVSAAVAAAGNLAQALLVAADVPEFVRFFSPWYWYLRENLLVQGPDAMAVVPALILSAAVAGLAWPRFLARDLN